MPPSAKKTWVVVVRGASASIFERAAHGGELTRLPEIPAQPAGALDLRRFATFLDAARRARSFERLMLVAPGNDVDELVSELSKPTRALVTALQPELVRTLPQEHPP